MNSRDSSSMTASRGDGTSPMDHEGVHSSNSSLAKEAVGLFQSRKYAECVDVLLQIHRKEDDLKVLHNIALAKYYRDGCSNHWELIEELVNIKKKYKDIDRASGEQLEAGSQHGNKAASGPKGTNSVGHHISENNASLLYRNEFDSSVVTLNLAIILYHLHDYARAMPILEPLFPNIEPIDEGTALRVCLLLLDLAVASQDAAMFSDVINYVEKAFCVDHVIQAENRKAGLQSSNLVMKSSSIPANVSTVDDLNSGSSASANASTNFLSRTLSDESAEYETLLSTLDMGSQNISRPANLPSSNDLPRSPDQLSSLDLKAKLPLYRVQLLFLTRRLKMAKRELKLAMNIPRGMDSSSALLLKSQLELAGENYVKAEKLLKACYNQADTGSSVIYNNNVGCIFFQWGKIYTAGVFFRNALLACSSIRKERPNEISKVSQDKSLLIFYNSGLQYMACGNPVLAAQCFQKATLVFYCKPLLWLRLAECCLLALEKGLCKSIDRLLCGPEFQVTVIGQGKWRQLSMKDGLIRKSLVSSTEKGGSTLGSDLSLSFARQCLWNALDLMCRSYSKSVKLNGLESNPEEIESSEVVSAKNPNHEQFGVEDFIESDDMLSLSQVHNRNGDIKEQKTGGNVMTSLSSVSDYRDAFRIKYLKVKEAILVDLAFVELELGNPHAALSKARSILEVPECSKLCAFLARVYAAEALCLLNKPKEAAEQLSVYCSGGNIELPFGKEDCEQWKVNGPSDPEESYAVPEAKQVHYKPEDGQGVLLVNLASLFAMQGNFDLASRYAEKALSVTPNSREASLMCVYMDLKLGRVQEARARLRSYNHVSFHLQGARLKVSS